MTKVMLIDDHPMINMGLAACLEGTGRFTVCAQATTLADAKRHIEEASPGGAESLPAVVILDVVLGDENGLDFLPFLENHCRANELPRPAVLICSVLEEPFRIQTAMKQGASGYVSKAESEAALIAAIDAVLRGGIHLSDSHSAQAIRSLGLYERLSKRELKVLEMIKQNKSNAEIADELFLSIGTVRNHVSNIYFKTETSSRQELMKL